MTQRDKRSPIKDNPLRNPGQSVDEQREKLLYDRAIAPSIVAFAFVVMAGVEWVRYFFTLPPQPILYSLAGLGSVGYAAWCIWRVNPQLRALRQASDGEKVVGQFLEGLRQGGYRVFHDVLGEGFNLDHVLVGPQGVFTVETKTLSKPARGEAKIEFNGERIITGGFEPDRDPVVQAKAQAHWLKNLLQESTGRQISVRPIVTYPGWYIDGPPQGVKSEVWVLNPKAIPSFIAHERNALTPEDVSLLSYHLSRYARAESAATAK